MRKVFVLLIGMMIIYSNLSAQLSIVVDFEGSPTGTSCATYADAVGSGNGFDVVATGSGGFGGASISNFLPTADMSGQTCLMPPDNFILFTADTAFSSISADMHDVTVTVVGTDGATLDSIAQFTGFYTFNGTFKSISFGNGAGGSPTVDNITLTIGEATAPRINAEDVAAPVALFCYPQGGIDIYTVENSAGTFLTRALPVDILRARQQAESSGANTAIYNDGNVSLWVLSTGEMQVNAGSKYVDIFSYERMCGALPAVDITELEPAPAQNPVEEFVIINRPR